MKFNNHGFKFFVDALNTLREEIKSVQKAIADLRHEIKASRGQIGGVDHQFELRCLWLLNHEPDIPEKDTVFWNGKKEGDFLN